MLFYPCSFNLCHNDLKAKLFLLCKTLQSKQLWNWRKGAAKLLFHLYCLYGLAQCWLALYSTLCNLCRGKSWRLLGLDSIEVASMGLQCVCFLYPCIRQAHKVYSLFHKHPLMRLNIWRKSTITLLSRAHSLKV